MEVKLYFLDSVKCLHKLFGIIDFFKGIFGNQRLKQVAFFPQSTLEWFPHNVQSLMNQNILFSHHLGLANHYDGTLRVILR